MEWHSIRTETKRMQNIGDRDKRSIARMLNQEKKLSINKTKFGLRVNYFIKKGF